MIDFNLVGNIGTSQIAEGYQYSAKKNAGVFASDIAGRISGKTSLFQETEKLTPGDYAQSVANQDKKLEDLESGIAESVRYIAGKFGERAGTAAMAIMYKHLDQYEGGPIDEQALGNAFLDVTRFLDKQEGIEAGDAFIKHLNGNLNEAMNEYFDNGLNEEFIATTTVPPASLSQENDGIFLEMDNAEAPSSTDLILNLIEEGRNTEADDHPYAQTLHASDTLGLLTDTQA